MRSEEQAVDGTPPAIGQRSEAGDERATALWESVDALLARAPLPGILTHKLGPLAAHRLRRLGETVPPPLLLEERAAVVATLGVVPLLERVRSSCDGPLVLLKGPEVARLYPRSSRLFGDIDLLVPDAHAVREGLLREGFAQISHAFYTPDWHQLEQTFTWRDNGIEVDVHKTPKWPVGLRTPPALAQEILEASAPSGLSVTGISAPAPHHHALILAAHSWSHEPLWTLRDLIDIALVSTHADDRDLDRTALAWGLRRLWRTTQQTVEALFFDGRSTIPLRTWARHLDEVRGRTGVEAKVTGLLQGYWGMPPRQGFVQTLRAVRHML